MTTPQIKVKINKDMLKSALGRLSLDNMPDGDVGKILVAQGAGKNPIWTDPNVTVIDFSDQALNKLAPLRDYGKINTSFKRVAPVSIAGGSRALRLNQAFFTPSSDILVLASFRWMGHPLNALHEGHFWLHTGTWSSWETPLDLKLILLEMDSHHHAEYESRDYVKNVWYPIPIKIPANTTIYWSSDYLNLTSGSVTAFDEYIEIVYVTL
jgi:hypothetical protein